MKERDNRQHDNADQRSSKDTSTIHISETQEASSSPEISRMDRREGNLEHGEIGGGLIQEADNKKEKE